MLALGLYPCFAHSLLFLSPVRAVVTNDMFKNEMDISHC